MANIKKVPQRPPLWIQYAFAEMDGSDDRTAAIVAAGIVDEKLAHALMSRMVELGEDEQHGLFRNVNALLNDLGAKVQLGFALNLFGAEVRDDLNVVRKVRNLFAHEIEVRTFDDPEVAKLCAKLVGPRHLAHAKGQPEAMGNRQRLLDTAVHLGARFDIDSRCPRRPPPSGAILY